MVVVEAAAAVVAAAVWESPGAAAHAGLVWAGSWAVAQADPDR